MKQMDLLPHQLVQDMFPTVISSSFNRCCIAATEYPALNMLTALCLALKASLVIVARIYAREFEFFVIRIYSSLAC